MTHNCFSFSFLFLYFSHSLSPRTPSGKHRGSNPGAYSFSNSGATLIVLPSSTVTVRSQSL